MRKRFIVLAMLCALIVLISSLCSGAEAPRYKTRNVIVAVMDGVRYCETFGDTNRTLIPRLAALEKEGSLFTNFRIAGSGISVTRQGHSTISSGTWQTVALAGARMTMPSFFEYARNELGWKQTDCWAIFGKGKYSYADYSSFPGYGEKYRPSFVIGIGEKEMPNDDAVLDQVFKAMDQDKPHLMFINFGVTDHLAHVSTFQAYCDAIKHCDEMFGKLWDKIQSTPGYKDETTVFFTNDHGRHTEKPQMDHNGFQSHGDQCDGCRRIMLLAVGPDVKRGAVVDAETQEIDICPTVGELLGFQTPFAQGKVLSGCLANPLGLNKKAANTAEAKEGVRLAELSKRDLVKTISEANLSRDAGSLKPSIDTELLMRGMLKASVVTNNDTCRKYVESWLEKNSALAATDPRVARVMLELGQMQAQAPAVVDLEKIKQCATKLTENWKGADDITTYANIGFLARAGQVFGDQKLKDTVKTALGLDGKTEQQIIVAWQQLKVNDTPMACDVPEPVTKSATMSDAALLMAMADASAAMPNDRMVRLACDLQESYCSLGRPELGANWKDSAQSAVTLAAVLDANSIKPKIKWVNGVKAKAKKKKNNQGPRWANPMQFYKDSIPWQIQLLRYQVDTNGHFASGDPMNDGAMLNLLCDSRGKVPGDRKLTTQMN